MTSNAPPSRDPANDDTLIGFAREILGKFLQGVDDMLPARVIAVNPERTRVQVQPLVKVVTTSGEAVSRAQLLSVPILSLGGGGFVLSFPVNTGDLGWIKANDRDIALFLQSYAESTPNTSRKHSFSDAVFIPDAMRGFTIAGEDADRVVLQSLDGAARISLGADAIKLSLGDDSVSLEAGVLTVDVPLTTFTGAVTVALTLGVTGTITGADFIPTAGPTYLNHDHNVNNVEPGSATRTTTGPQ